MTDINTPRRWLALLFTIAIVSGLSARSAPHAATQLSAQPGQAYALILGPSAIDDGLAPTSDAGQSASSAFSAAADAFGSASASAAPPPSVAAAKSLDAAIPPSEYDLTELAKTLSDDPDALYRFVTDRIAVDGYDGVMRGPLVTWMSRAGSPTDKTVLLAWLLVTKHVPYQFVRGTLAPAERARVADAAASPAPAASPDPKVASYTAALTKDGGEFATWARGLLSAAHVTIADAAPAADRVSSRHYWIQIVRNNTLIDLDPTLPGTAAGTHLGTIDASFKPTSAFPTEEWHQLEIRVTAALADNTEKTIVDRTDTVANLAYSPIRLVFAPAAPADPLQPGSATSFEAGLQIGSTTAAHSHLDLGTGPASVRSVVLDVRRKAPGGAVVEVAHRSLIDARTPPADRAYRLAGMTTMIVAPGRGAIAFATHMQFRALQQWAQAVADAAKGAPAPQPWYPIRLIDYFERDDAVADALASNGGARLFRDRPNVAMLRTSFVRRGAATDVVTAFDIADNGMDSLAPGRDAVATENMIRGYADTRIEHDVAEAPSGTGTIALFEAARAGNVAPAVLTQAPPVADDLHDGIDRTLAAGQVAIAPSAPVKVDDRALYGWWAIDPKTGNSVGRMTGGAGQDLAEESAIINTLSRAYTLYGQMQTARTCAKSGFASAGCAASICASIASYVFGGGTAAKFASNLAAGQIATAGCSGGFGAGTIALDASSPGALGGLERGVGDLLPDRPIARPRIDLQSRQPRGHRHHRPSR